MGTLVEAEIWTVARTDQGNAVLLRPKGSDVAVPIFIGQLETQAILIGLGKVDVPRPLTHDLFLATLKAINANIDRVEINELREGTFYGRLIVSSGESQVTIDARPSDAIGIAARNGCKVFIAEQIVDEAAISVNLVTESLPIDDDSIEGKEGLGDDMDYFKPMPTPEEKSALAAERDRLQLLLDRAVAEENYEEAAMLRDRLNSLGKA